MSYGFSLQNASGDIVIDQNFRNLEVIQSGTVSGSGGRFSVSFPATEFALCFFQTSPGNHFAFGRTTTTSAFWYSAGLSTCGYIIVAPRSDGNVGTQPGIAVFDGSSRCVFSSNRSYIKITSAFNIPNGLGYQQTHTHADAPYSDYICGGYMGLLFAFCDIYAMRTLRRTATNALYADGVMDESLGEHLMGYTTGDWGAGFSTPNYGWPILFGRL